MEFATELLAFFTDPARWRGTTGIPNRTLEHLHVSALALGLAVALAAPSGVALGHLRRGGTIAMAVVNLGRALPSFAIIALALPVSISMGLGLGFWPTFLALFLLALPPIFTNSYTALVAVAPDAVESARGMGMRESGVLMRLELPLATPVMLAGIRVAAVQVVATAPLGALVGFGGLGRYIIDGLALQDHVMMVAGAILVAALAIVVELAFSAVERLFTAAGVRTPGRARGAAVRPV